MGTLHIEIAKGKECVAELKSRSEKMKLRAIGTRGVTLFRLQLCKIRSFMMFKVAIPGDRFSYSSLWSLS